MLRLFESFEKRGFLKKGKPDDAKIDHASITEILDCAQESVELTTAKNLQRESSIFSFSTSLELGGGRSSCAEISCRIERIDEVARFAALYADRVYIKNLLADHLRHTNIENQGQESDLKQRFRDDLAVFSSIRPVVEKNLVIPITPPSNYCPHCLAKLRFGKDADRRLDKEANSLIKRYLDEIDYKFLKMGNHYILLYDGPELLIEHGGKAFLFSKLPTELLNKPRIIQRVDSGETVSLSHGTIRKIEIHKLLASEVFQNVLFSLSTSQCLGTSFLTGQKVHTEILNSLSCDKSLQEQNSLAEHHLTSFVPILENLNIEKVIEVREREAEAFIIYRQALSKAIQEYRKLQKNPQIKEAKAIYGDIIAPGLAKLDRRVKIAKKSLIKDTGRELISWGAAISFGYYAGFLQGDLIKIASSLGLLKIIQELSNNLMKKSDTESEIKGEEMYFLWKVQKKAKK